MPTAKSNPMTVEDVDSEFNDSRKSLALAPARPDIDRVFLKLMGRIRRPKTDVLMMVNGYLKAAADAIAEG